MTVTREDLLAHTAGRLVVPCQAYPGEPMRTPDTTARAARAARAVVAGGTAAPRVQGPDDVRATGTAITHPTSLTRWFVEAMR